MHARKMLVFLAALVALALLAAGCVVPSAPQTVVETVVVRETVEVEKEVEVLVTPTPGALPEGGLKVIPFLTNETDPESVELFQQVFAEYSEENPDVSIDLVLGGHGNIGQRVVAAAAVGADMGVVQVAPRDMQDFIQAGYLLPLDDVVNALGEDQFKPNVVVRGEDGKVYALGYSGGTHATLWVRTDQLEEVGMEPPTSYDEFLAAAEATTRDLDGDGRIDIYGVGLPAGPDGATSARFISFAYQNCCDYFDKEGNLTFDKPECLDALEKYVALLEYAPPGIEGWSWFDGIDAFISGKVAMHPYGGRLGVNLDRAAPDIREDTKVIWYPVGDKVQAGRGGYDYLAVFSGSKHPEAAKDFMEYFYGGDGLARFQLTVPGHLIPPTNAMTEWVVESSGNEYVEKYKDDVLTLFDSSNYTALPDINMGAIETETCEYNPTLNPMPWGGAIFGRTPPIDSEMIQRVVVGGETPEEAWEWAYTEMQKAADEWKAANPDWTPAGQ